MRTTLSKTPRMRSTRPPGLDREFAGQAMTSGRNEAILSCDELRTRVAKRAYELYVERGCRQGGDVQDWLEAEREILGLNGLA